MGFLKDFFTREKARNPLHEAIKESVEPKRGCGYRKKGGLYLVSDAEGRGCGKFPLELDKCPCCGGGIKPSRGWTWIDGGKILDVPCSYNVMPIDIQTQMASAHCAGCPAHGFEGQAGLLWVGGKFYKEVDTFLDEAAKLGISRRISSVPRDFVLGETWVLLAHREVIGTSCEACNGTGQITDDLSEDEPKLVKCPTCKGRGETFKPAIFRMFLPTAIEVIVDGTEDKETIDKFVERGLSPVLVKKEEEDA